MRPVGTDPYLISVILDRDNVPSFEDYPFCIPAIRNLRELEFHPKVTYFVGDNGTGKSTLLEAIAVAAGFNPEGGSRDFNFSTRESHSELYDHVRLKRGIRRPTDGYFLRAESFFNLATEVDSLGVAFAYGGTSLHEQSHGESFMSLLTKRFRGNGLYLLDEPEAALSPSRQLGVLTRMHDLIEKNSQFVIVTHSPILMAYPDSTIYLFSDDAIMPIDYTETEHYTITRDFLNRREAMLRVLLGADSDSA